MVRRLKQDVMRELPPKRRQVIRLPAPRDCDWPKHASGLPAISPKQTVPTCYSRAISMLYLLGLRDWSLPLWLQLPPASNS